MDKQKMITNIVESLSSFDSISLNKVHVFVTNLKQIEKPPIEPNIKEAATMKIPSGWNIVDKKDYITEVFYNLLCEKKYCGYDLAILYEGPKEFIPVHGSVHMEKVDSLSRAARKLDHYVDKLPDSHKIMPEKTQKSMSM